MRVRPTFNQQQQQQVDAGATSELAAKLKKRRNWEPKD